MTRYLFLFTIGPVQSFISQARKTQDLYAGSNLLSDLINYAIKEIGENNIIFPNKTVESKPNRFLAEIEAIDSNEVKLLGEKIEKEVRDRFKTISNDIFDHNFPKANKPKNYDKQIENFLDIYWVAKETDGSNYKQNHSQIESLLGAIKNIRQFNQLEEQGRKCSLCGERNTVVYKKNRRGRPAYIQSDAIAVKESNFTLSSGEGLCAVCYTKRVYKTGTTFPSTAEIALQFTIDKIFNSNNIKEPLKIKNMLEYNYQLAYKDNLTKNFFSKNDIRFELKKAIKWQNHIKDISKNNKLKLSKYYAMIMFDGDNMGKWLSGKGKLKENVDLKEFHNEFSKLLGKYGSWAKDYLDGNESDNTQKGKAVYAGGDDFMGFINLQYLFKVLKKLREQFDKIVNNNLKGYKKDSEKLTFSAGIVIAHYKTPLGEVINWSRKMEKEAKEINDTKDAFSIAVLKHSGEINKTRYKWYEDNIFITDYMKDIVMYLKNEHFSNTFIKVLNIEFEKLVGENEKLEVRSGMLETEIKRLVNKSCMLSLDKNAKKEAISSFSKKILSLNFDKDNFRSFIHFLNIADFIAREIPANLEEDKV